MANFQYDALKENVSVIGAAQVGKTEFSKKLCKMLANNGYNVIVFDVHRKFTDVDPMAVKRTLTDLRGKGLEIFQPYEITKQGFNDFCAVVYSFTNVVVIIDELHNFCSKFRAESNLELLARNCNNRDIGYIAIFQRPQEVPSFILSNSHHKFCFRLDLPTDIEYMKKWIGHDVDKFVNDEMPDYQGFYKMQGKKAEEFKA